MIPRLMIATLVLASMGIAGCVSRPSPECDNDAARCPPADSPPIIPSRVQTTQFERCLGALGNTQVPYEKARPFVPDAFAVQGYTGETVALLHGAFTCERIAIGSEVFPNQQFFFTAIFVEPRNTTWGHGFVNYYWLDFRSSLSSLVSALQNMNVLAELAEFSASNVTVAGNAQDKTWTVSNDNSSFRFRYATPQQPSVRENLDLQFWSGQEEFHSIQVQWNDTLDAIVHPSAIEMSGSSKVREMLGDTFVAQHGEVLNLNMKWSLIETKYAET